MRQQVALNELEAVISRVFLVIVSSVSTRLLHFQIFCKKTDNFHLSVSTTFSDLVIVSSVSIRLFYFQI